MPHKPLKHWPNELNTALNIVKGIWPFLGKTMHNSDRYLNIYRIMLKHQKKLENNQFLKEEQVMSALAHFGIKSVTTW